MSLGFRTFSVLIGVAAVAIMSTSPVDAAGNAKHGKQIAEKWCATCHNIDPSALRFDKSKPPSFQEIADTPTMNEAALRTFFGTPHLQMPNFSVTKEIRDHLIAYITSLKHR